MAKRMDPAFFVAWRNKAGLTQTKLSKILDVSESTIKKWEAGDRKIPNYMGLLMAAIDRGLEPLGQDAMIEGPDDKS
ncbi:helix-turn-helix transcriptional regulator (plasmid) [Agrobacterium tumefaciens]|uniref:helix-turn-helix domain-containing protein n=1 Tax=Agrobacterium tumefaciens TaxID=358 RepID=UPI0021D044A5|nr:helix-turn-helix transcriptional regulator [Agrobacterium tumefaciens]UXT53277.1 helix-turn-helix transcriptional regulator [Agrobacterium tumefaciens]